MKKVCIIQNYPNPYRMALYNKLSSFYKLEVVFLQTPASEGRRWKDYVKSENFSIKYMESIKIKKMVLNKGLSSYFLRQNYDVIIGTENLPNIMPMLEVFIISRFKKQKFILWTEEFGWHHYLKSGINRFMYDSFSKLYRAILYKKSDAFIAFSSAAVEVLKENNVNSNKVFKTVQAIEEINSKYLENKKLKSKDNVNFITIAYLRKEKGIEILMESFKKLSEKYNNVKLTIVGDGEYRKELEKMKVAGVTFTGYLDGEDKYYELAKSDVFVFPSLKDSWGLVANEAMTFGLPIICSDKAACFMELIKDNGFVYEAYDKEKLANLMEKFVINRELISKMGERSKEIIKEYTIDNCAIKFKEAIDKED